MMMDCSRADLTVEMRVDLTLTADSKADSKAVMTADSKSKAESS